ncbi:MAG: ABC transporter permease [Alicyclobacillus sp.]|nr:ABC transporter permease [Alicyclobacillus sp.]
MAGQRPVNLFAPETGAGARGINPPAGLSARRSARGEEALRWRLLHNPWVLCGAGGLLLVAGLCVCAPLLTGQSPVHQYLENTDAPPSPVHWLGTDNSGFDLWARDLYGGRTDLLLGLAGTLLSTGLGLGMGSLAGWRGGWVDGGVMRLCDLVLTFPSLLLVVVLAGVIHHVTVLLLLLLLSATAWPPAARLVRGLLLQLRQADFVIAARLAGAGPWRIWWRHLLPHLVGPLLVNATFTAANLMAVEGGLAVIGFGVQPPQPSWGNVIHSALDYFTLQTEPWVWVPPTIGLSWTVMSLTCLGEGLRQVFHPEFTRHGRRGRV